MTSKYMDDSVIPAPPHEGVGTVQDSQNQHEPRAAGADLSTPQHTKPIFGRRPTLGDLIGWYAGAICKRSNGGTAATVIS